MSASSLSPVPRPRIGVLVARQAVGRRTVLSVSGEIDLGSVPRLAEAIDDALGDGAHELWIDLAGTHFMDSAGLHLLLDVRSRVGMLNRRLAVICPPGNVRRLFDIARVADRFRIYADRAGVHHAA